MDQSLPTQIYHPSPQRERVKSRRRSDQSDGSLSFSSPNANATTSLTIELIHQTLKVICQWTPGNPVAGLTQAENAYLALSGIAYSQVEFYTTKNAQKADESLSAFMESLDMTCDTPKYDQWRCAVTYSWRLINERHHQHRPAHSIKRLLSANPLEEPPRDCLGALSALGLLQSMLPEAGEIKSSHPLNPLFVLKRRNPDMSLGAICQAFETTIDEQAFAEWNMRVNSIMECMGPLPRLPAVNPEANTVFFPDLNKPSTEGGTDSDDPRFLRFFLGHELKEVAAAFLDAHGSFMDVADVNSAVMNPMMNPMMNPASMDFNSPDGSAWLNRVSSLHNNVIGGLFDQLGSLQLLQTDQGFTADLQSVCQSQGTVSSYARYYQIIVPVSGTEGYLVAIDGTLVGWNLDFGYVVDERVHIWTNAPIQYISVFVRKR